MQVSFTGATASTSMPVAAALRPVPTQPGRLVAVGEADPDWTPASSRKTLAKLGPLVDPDKDCKMVRDDKGVKITVPGKLHSLAPQIRGQEEQAGQERAHDPRGGRRAISSSTSG